MSRHCPSIPAGRPLNALRYACTCKSAAMSLAHRNLERIVRRSSAESAAQERGAGLDLRAIVRVTSGSRLEVDDVEVRSLPQSP
jgi:hypothetical protein